MLFFLCIESLQISYIRKQTSKLFNYRELDYFSQISQYMWKM